MYPRDMAVGWNKVEDVSQIALETTEELKDAFGNFQWAADAVEKHVGVLLNTERALEDKVAAVQELKIMLCCNRDNVFPIAQDVIDYGGLQGLLDLSNNKSNPSDLRVSAAFCLTNIAAGTDEQTNALVQQGAIPVMLSLLETDDEALRRQALFCLANIAGSTSDVRCSLIRSPMYLKALKFAMQATRDVKIEELAGWNIRNTVVLGGPTFEECIPAIGLFIDHMNLCSPAPKLALKLVQNGSASITAMTHNTPHWTKFGPPDVNTTYTGVSSHYKPVFRYVAEILTFVSRSQEGREYLHFRNVYINLLYLAKFSYNGTVRTYCLETLVNMVSNGAHAHCRAMIDNGAVPAFAELLADSFTYSANQRSLAAQGLWFIASTADPTEVACMAEPVTITLSTILVSRRDNMEMVEFCPSYPLEIMEMTAPEVRRDFVDTDLPMKCERLSVLEIAYDVYAENDYREELSLREKCARIIIAVLGKLSDRILAKYLRRPFIELFIRIMEMAVVADSTALSSREVNDWKELPEPPKLDSTTTSQPAVFTTQCFLLLQRIIDVGETMRLQLGAVDNLTCPLLKAVNGPVRLQNTLSSSCLPHDIVDWAGKMILKYA